MLTLIFLLVFAAVSLVSWLVFRPVTDDVSRRLGIAGATPVSAPRENLIRRTVFGLGRRIGRVAARFLPQNFVTEIERKLIQANEPWPLVGFLGAWAASAAFGILLL